MSPQQLPLPRHEQGYPTTQLQDVLGREEMLKFKLWMWRQSVHFDDEAGIVYPAHDVKVYLETAA